MTFFARITIFMENLSVRGRFSGESEYFCTRLEIVKINGVNLNGIFENRLFLRISDTSV